MTMTMSEPVEGRGETGDIDAQKPQPAPLGLLVTLDDDMTVYDPRVVPISLSSLLWLR